MAIPLKWREKLRNLSFTANNYHTELKLLSSNRTNFKLFTDIKSKELYIMLLNIRNSRHIPSCKAKWTETYPLENLNWKIIYSNAFKTCRSTKLQSFQYRILNRTISCNHWLFNIKIKDNPNCAACQVDDNLPHFFIECKQVKQFWISFSRWWQRICGISLTLTNANILFGVNNATATDNCINYLLIQAKKFIHDNKLNESNNISFYTFLHYIKNQLIVEKAICENNRQLQSFEGIFGIVFNNL
jgi:hypothetical protein